MMWGSIAMALEWWHDDPQERYWLESTDRPDIGADLRAPLIDGSGRDNWRYTLFREAKIGNVVFHYDKNQAAITAVSRIAGPPVEAPIIWAARGSYARERGAQPVELPGYRIPLDEHAALTRFVTLEDLRSARPTIQALYDDLVTVNGAPLYFPFELSTRPLRPLQGYAFKLPASFVRAFPPLEAGFAISGRSNSAASGSDEAEIFRGAVSAIEAAASPYAIAGLQRLRAKTRGLKRVSRTIFGSRVRADDWTFHHGGRDELQFNIGLDFMDDGLRALRAGVAFSFEPSRSFPDIEVLVPKVARFNSWMRENSEALGDLAMWHWRSGVRSDDYAPGPISETLVRPGNFIFLGHRQGMGGD